MLSCKMSNSSLENKLVSDTHGSPTDLIENEILKETRNSSEENRPISEEDQIEWALKQSKTCKFCSIFFQNEGDFINHKCLASENDQLKWALEQSKAETSKAISPAVSQNNSEFYKSGNTFLCDLCPNVYTNAELMKNHMKESHLDFVCKKWVKCQFCDDFFQNQEENTNHKCFLNTSEEDQLKWALEQSKPEAKQREPSENNHNLIPINEIESNFKPHQPQPSKKRRKKKAKKSLKNEMTENEQLEFVLEKSRLEAITNKMENRQDTLNNLQTSQSKVGTYRPIVIDGCNIGHAYGRGPFRAEGLRIVHEYFTNLGYDNENIIMIIKHIPPQYLTEEDTNLLNFFKDIGVLHESPSRKFGTEVIKSDDDLFILNTARLFKANILSNDRYREYESEYFDVIKTHLIQPNFIKDELVLPTDPLGSNGPKLDQFLRF